MNKNKNYSKEFKFKVALETIKGDLTLAQIVSKYQVPQSVLCRWKKQLLENGAEVYNNNSKVSKSGESETIEKLHETIGRLKVENDFLQEVSARLKL